MTLHHLFKDLTMTCDLIRREALYNILTELGAPVKQIRLIKMCLNETYTKVCKGKHLCDTFLAPNGLKEGEGLLTLLSNFNLDISL